MQHSIILITGLLLSLTFSTACSSSRSDEDQRALPKEWLSHSTPDQQPEPQSAELPPLSASADQAVQEVFQAHSQALGSVHEPVPPLQSPLESITHLPSDWVPWHLQGFIASFAVSVEGVLGSLLFEGEPAIKGIWQRAHGSSSSSSSVNSSKKADLRVTPRTSSEDVNRQIEPAIRAAISTGILKDRRAQEKLRATVVQYAQTFRSLCRALSSTSFVSQGNSRGSSNWSVENFRLELNFDSSGAVTPVTAVGANVNFRFDWEKNEQSSPPQQANTNSDLQRNLQAFISAVSEDIQKVTSDSSVMKNSPFELDEIRIGLGMSASGNIGIATDAASIIGSITFSKSEPTVKSPSMSSSNSEDSILLVRTSKPEHAGLRNRIKRFQFRTGLSRALSMGRYFAEAGAKLEHRASSWILSEIEAEFEMSLGGTLGITTVDGLGVVVCTFSRKE